MCDVVWYTNMWCRDKWWIVMLWSRHKCSDGACHATDCHFLTISFTWLYYYWSLLLPEDSYYLTQLFLGRFRLLDSTSTSKLRFLLLDDSYYMAIPFTWLYYYLTIPSTWLHYYLTIHITWLYFYAILFLLDSTITWRFLLFHSSFILENSHCLTLLLLDTIPSTWLRYSLTIPITVLDPIGTLILDSAMSFVYRKFLNRKKSLTMSFHVTLFCNGRLWVWMDPFSAFPVRHFRSSPLLPQQQ